MFYLVELSQIIFVFVVCYQFIIYFSKYHSQCRNNLTKLNSQSFFMNKICYFHNFQKFIPLDTCLEARAFCISPEPHGRPTTHPLAAELPAAGSPQLQPPPRSFFFLFLFYLFHHFKHFNSIYKYIHFYHFHTQIYTLIFLFSQ